MTFSFRFGPLRWRSAAYFSHPMQEKTTLSQHHAAQNNKIQSHEWQADSSDSWLRQLWRSVREAMPQQL